MSPNRSMSTRWHTLPICEPSLVGGRAQRAIRRAARSATAGDLGEDHALQAVLVPAVEHARDRRRRSASAWRRAPPVRAAGRSSRRRCRARAAPEQLGQLARLQQIGAVDDDDVHRQLHRLSLAAAFAGDLDPGVEQRLDALGELARSVSVTAIRQASAPSYVCGSHRANPQSAAAVSVVRIHSRTSAGECVVARFITTPRATDRARSGWPTMPSEPVRSRLVLDRRAPLVFGQRVVGIVGDDRRRDRRQADGNAHEVVVRRRPLPHPPMPRRGDEQRQPAAVRCRPAPVALLTAQGENVLAERGEVGGVGRRRVRHVALAAPLAPERLDRHTIGPMIMIRRKIQRPVIAAKPKPVTSGSSARHHMPPLLGPDEPWSLGASTFGGSADWAGRYCRGKTRSAPSSSPTTAMSARVTSTTARTELPTCRYVRPRSSVGPVISTPSTEVPFVEPRSVTVTVSAPSTRAWSIRQCRPDSSESSRCRSARAERPMVTPPPIGNGTWRPASGPHTTTRCRPTPGCAGSGASAPHVSVEPCASPRAPIVPGRADRDAVEPDRLGVEPELLELPLQRFGGRRDLAVDEHVVQPFLRVAELRPPDRHDAPGSSTRKSSTSSSVTRRSPGHSTAIGVSGKRSPPRRSQVPLRELEVTGDQHTVDELHADVAARHLRVIDAEHRRRAPDEHRLRAELDSLPGDDVRASGGPGPDCGVADRGDTCDQFVDDAGDDAYDAGVLDRGVDRHRVAAASGDGSV